MSALSTVHFLIVFIFSANTLFGQEIKIGFQDSIQSPQLNENRKFIIKLPNGYNNTDKSYPVLYRLDGNLDIYFETLAAVNRLVYMEESMPEMIVVMIENTEKVKNEDLPKT